MDMRTFFQKIKQVETAIPDEFVIVVSLETPDGGKPGLMTEVIRSRAARLVVEGRARLASAEEACEFRKEAKDAVEAFVRAERAQNVRVVVIPEEDSQEPKKNRRS
jgi:hypothetical protein